MRIRVDTRGGERLNGCRTARIPQLTGGRAGLRRGQSTVEVAVLVSMAVSAFVFMMVYMQRAYQHYLYVNASDHGSQFDPTQPYVERQQLKTYSQVQDIDVLSGEAAVDFFKGNPDLPSVPGGTLPGELLVTKANAKSEWSINRTAIYEAR